MPVKPIPDEYSTVTPYLIVNGASRLMEFLKNVLGAQERMRMGGPDGTIGHAEMTIGDSVIMLADAGPMAQPTSPMLHVYVENTDEVYRKALAAGATSTEAPTDKFYGDRSASVTDSFGIRWSFATHVEDVSPAEMERRASAVMAQA
jgi:uncharacterized glyoxalase superfamily protein PhnB